MEKSSLLKPMRGFKYTLRGENCLRGCNYACAWRWVDSDAIVHCPLSTVQVFRIPLITWKMHYGCITGTQPVV
jgi:hypothetical protein